MASVHEACGRLAAQCREPQRAADQANGVNIDSITMVNVAIAISALYVGNT